MLILACESVLSEVKALGQEDAYSLKEQDIIFFKIITDFF